MGDTSWSPGEHRIVCALARVPRRRIADVAQLVEHHLAKVRVAGSSPVVRSERVRRSDAGGVAERRGNGLQSRLHGFESRLHLAVHEGDWRSGSALP
jgi:hypothetical protein